MDNKKFMTYKEQIDFLKNEKQLIIDDSSKALMLLKRHSYFALINGYKYPFKRQDGLYKKNTTLDDIYALYCFDNKIRYIIIQNIMDVEIHIKSLMSYSFAYKFGESEPSYLEANNYNYDNKKYQSDIDDFIIKLTNIVNDYKSSPYMKHQKENHGNIPPWVIIKALTLGNISKMYSFQKPSIQTMISKEFVGVTEGDLTKFLDLLTRFRNVCAHNERLFDYRYNKGSINNMAVHHELCIPNRKNNYIKGKSDLFAVLITLKYLQQKDKFHNMVQELSKEIKNLLDTTHQIQKEQLYKYMGFPDNWELIDELNIL